MPNQQQSIKNRFAIVTLIPAFVALSMFSTGCSSASKEESSPANAATEAGSSISRETILENYTVKQFDAVANALQIIQDNSSKEAGKDFGQELLGCSIPGDKASAMLSRVKSLISDRLREETQNYAAGPTAYGESMGFGRCGQTCSCRIFATVIEDVSTSSMKPIEQKAHARYQKSLKSKAGIQTDQEANACARQQTWFCSSDLHKFLQQ